jgi:hypothetical protein
LQDKCSTAKQSYKQQVYFLLLVAMLLVLVLLPQTAWAESTSKPDLTNQEIIAVTHLASHREILSLHGIKKMAIGVSPLPQALADSSDKSLTATSLCNILSKRAQSCLVEIDAKAATHLLLLTLSPLAKHDYQLVLTVRPLKNSNRPIYTMKMRATMSGHYPQRLNELIERASIIFWRNYQLAN